MPEDTPRAEGNPLPESVLDVEELIQRFTRRVIHNVSNPLAAILGCSQLLERLLDRGGPEDLAQCRGYVAMVQAEALRCSRMMDGLAALARPPAPCLAAVDLHDVVYCAVAAFPCPEGTRIEVDAGAAPSTVTADADLLTKALLHLLQNAVDAMPQGGTVAVRTENCGEGVRRLRMVVADTGPGIPPDVLPRVAEPFFSTRQGHNGVGLAVCARLIAPQGGTLRVSSPPGSGAQAIIELPR